MKKPPPCGTGFILQRLMGQKLKQKQMSDSLTVGDLLAVVGGFLDAYTYLLRGHVFANAQTGNIVLLGLSAAQGEFLKASYYLLPILAFLCGVLDQIPVSKLPGHPLAPACGCSGDGTSGHCCLSAARELGLCRQHYDLIALCHAGRGIP